MTVEPENLQKDLEELVADFVENKLLKLNSPRSDDTT